MTIQPSALDSARFGIAIARGTVTSPAEVAEAVRDGRAASSAMLVLRAAIEDGPSVHAVEAAGGRLGDTLVYWRWRPGVAPAEPSGVRLAVSSDADAVEAIAARAFHGYGGHYHTDPRLDSAAADAGYAEWARRSVVDGAADRVWVVEDEGAVTGFLTMTINTPVETEIVLNAVDPQFQRRGSYGRLVDAALRVSSDLGSDCIVSTHLVNFGVQRVWARKDFLLESAQHTFHLWLD